MDVRLSVVLPAYNEEANLDRAIDEAQAALAELVESYEIVVVDDGSADRTTQVVERRAEGDPRIRLVRHGKNRGYGEALRTGFMNSRGELVFFTDADVQFDMRELRLLLAWIDRVDVVAGYRIDRQDRFARRLNAHAWNALVRVLFYVPVRDVDCAFKLFRRSVFDELHLEAVGAMVNTELMVRLARSGFSVVEVGVTHRPRLAGTARGANLKVIATAFRELFAMYGRLRRMDAGHHAPPAPTR